MKTMKAKALLAERYGEKGSESREKFQVEAYSYYFGEIIKSRRKELNGKNHQENLKVMVISINKAEYLGDYKIKFSFSDQTHKVIDFYVFLSSSRNPMTEKYLDKNLFQKYSIQYGDIIWNDYEMCFPIWDLHEGNI